MNKLYENIYQQSLKEYGLSGDVYKQSNIPEELLEEIWEKFLKSNKHGNKQAENFVIWNKDEKYSDYADQFAMFVEGYLAK